MMADHTAAPPWNTLRRRRNHHRIDLLVVQTHALFSSYGWSGRKCHEANITTLATNVIPLALLNDFRKLRGVHPLAPQVSDYATISCSKLISP